MKVSKAIPVTDRGGSHNVQTVGSQMAVTLSVLRSLLPRNIIFLLLVLISLRG
jgi:hypothetical protein